MRKKGESSAIDFATFSRQRSLLISRTFFRFDHFFRATKAADGFLTTRSFRDLIRFRSASGKEECKLSVDGFICNALASDKGSQACQGDEVPDHGGFVKHYLHLT
jgi:hypothetical protein